MTLVVVRFKVMMRKKKSKGCRKTLSKNEKEKEQDSEHEQRLTQQDFEHEADRQEKRQEKARPSGFGSRSDPEIEHAQEKRHKVSNKSSSRTECDRNASPEKEDLAKESLPSKRLRPDE